MGEEPPPAPESSAGAADAGAAGGASFAAGLASGFLGGAENDRRANNIGTAVRWISRVARVQLVPM